ncbi:hypothetical protein Sste5346_006944 [Sporothrix stenoceras]|uniref:Uncharacterized protein n=1 Tax=Sporothrix stenoceras TaxID=5173 RepID=A0ABR3YW99_9PEZI
MVTSATTSPATYLHHRRQWLSSDVVTDCDGGASGDFPHCFRVTSNSDDTQNLQIAQYGIPTDADGVYEVGIIYRLTQLDLNDGGSGLTQALLPDCYAGGNHFLSKDLLAADVSTSWTTFSTPITVPSSSSKLNCYIGPRPAIATFDIAFFYMGANCGSY